MQVVNLFEWFGRHQRYIQLVTAPILILMIIAVGTAVYMTGGIKYVYSHSMYMPIVLAGLIYGVRGGILIACISGLVVGPYMPISTDTGEMQLTINWMYRLGFFTLIGILSGIASDTVRTYIQHLIWLTHHDSATKLPNRLALLEDLKETVHTPTETSYLLLVLSLHQAQELKAAFGNKVIESIIQQIALRFNYILPKQTSIYRADTEEVSVLIKNINDTDINALLEELHTASRYPFLFEGIPVHVDSRMGYVIFDDDAIPDTYLQRAESALNAAHQTFLNYVEYQPTIKTAARETVYLLGELIKAVEQGQLFLHYQPKIDLNQQQIIGVEALMRWHHPLRGAIEPCVFIPCAEQSTLIHTLSHFALEEAIKTAMFFRTLDINLPVAVNISTYNLIQPNFSQQVINLLSQYGVAGHCLELEVTESALLKDVSHSIEELSKLAELGITISVDDFGTGYSSLQYLHQLPISHLKIDKSFITGLPDNKSSLPVLEATISMAHKMGIAVTAEGIESKQALELVTRLGCDFAQGFYISMPVSRKHFIEWYQQYQISGLTH